MKKITTLLASLLATVVLTSCGGDKPSDKLLDKDAMVYVNVQDGKATRAVNPDLPDNPAHLSPKELVAQAENMMLTTTDGLEGTFWLGGLIAEGDYLASHGRKVGEPQYKLLDQAKFVFWGDFVINVEDKENPKLVEEFFKSTNVRFEDIAGNIIGYIPQRVFREAWEEVKKAFDAKDYDRVYKLFQETYTAYPCTTEEWQKLKAEGKS